MYSYISSARDDRLHDTDSRVLKVQRAAELRSVLDKEGAKQRERRIESKDGSTLLCVEAFEPDPLKADH